MKKDNIFSIIAMGCGLLIILSVFLPYITYFSSSSSLWKMQDVSRFIYIILGSLVIFVYLINKKTELSYLTVGYGLFASLAKMLSVSEIGGLSIGFYLIFLSSFVIGVITFLYDRENAVELIEFNKQQMNDNSQIIDD